MKEKIFIIGFFVIVVLIVVFSPEINKNYIKNGKLYVSEIMSNNTYVIKDNDGEYSDYIEIYNGYKYEINLEGYYLSDSEFETKKWQFPKMKIQPEEYLIIFASGKNKCDLERRICHTNFKLSSNGEVITLSDKNGNIINKFSYPSLDNDISYGYKNKNYIIFDMATPGKENVSNELRIDNGKNDISINEYMTHNTAVDYTENGYYYDFVELYNGGEAVKLNNLYLSNDVNKLNKYRIPSVNIDKYGYLVIYLSGRNEILENEICANFKLGDDDEYLILSNGIRIFDKVEVVKLQNNISYGKVNEVWEYFPTPTPGKVNDTISFDELGGNDGST